LEHEQATVYGTTVDLGRGGLFLRTALPMSPGIAVRVTLRLPGRTPVVADGKVVRAVSPRLGDRPGLGVCFDRLPVGEETLDAFLCGTLDAAIDVAADVPPVSSTRESARGSTPECRSPLPADSRT
jgi:hypothetical protein